jgi:hypothetical protein
VSITSGRPGDVVADGAGDDGMVGDADRSATLPHAATTMVIRARATIDAPRHARTTALLHSMRGPAGTSM